MELGRRYWRGLVAVRTTFVGGLGQGASACPGGVERQVEAASLSRKLPVEVLDVDRAGIC